jgi:DNA-binding CsgD family transcriptional regulator
VARTLVAGCLAVDRGDHEVARDHLEVARTWCHQVGDGRLNGLLHRGLAELAVWQGRYDDARREVDLGLELLAHTGDPEMAARIAAVGVRVEADEADHARRAGGRRRERPVRSGRWAEGDGGAGPPDRTQALLSRLEALDATAVDRHAPPSSETRASLLTGRAEQTRVAGRPEPERWRLATEAWEAVGFPCCAAYTRFRGGEAALGAGDDGAARRQLRAAWEAAAGLGAAPLAGAVERLARRGRVDIGVAAAPGPVPGRTDGAAALTPRESEVLALVAEGRTNRQIGEALFISEKTASVHVSRLLAKLGAATRGEAAASARRAGLLGD